MKEFKIQTGLRVPEDQYDRLYKMAERIGVSLNSMLLMLIDVGLNVLEEQRR